FHSLSPRVTRVASVFFGFVFILQVLSHHLTPLLPITLERLTAWPSQCSCPPPPILASRLVKHVRRHASEFVRLMNPMIE
ncbi:hypothetical protein F5148DRAFT_1174481, partial [Russula earlei]